MEDTKKYDSIIDLPHHQSSTRPHMSMRERAAQFAPFATLSGHGAAIEETERLTDRFVPLTDEEKRDLDMKMQFLMQHLTMEPEIKITYFIPDERKSGGRYETVSGRLKKIDPYNGIIRLADRSIIEIRWITNIKCSLLKNQEES